MMVCVHELDMWSRLDLGFSRKVRNFDQLSAQWFIKKDFATLNTNEFLK